jgi:hypothetical protein
VCSLFDNAPIIFKGNFALFLEELLEESHLDGAFLEEEFSPDGPTRRQGKPLEYSRIARILQKLHNQMNISY